MEYLNGKEKIVFKYGSVTGDECLSFLLKIIFSIFCFDIILM